MTSGIGYKLLGNIVVPEVEAAAAAVVEEVVVEVLVEVGVEVVALEVHEQMVSWAVVEASMDSRAVGRMASTEKNTPVDRYP